MAANIAQLFPLVDSTSWTPTPMTAANATRDGTSGTLYLAATGTTNGDTVTNILFRSLGSNPVGVARVFLNNGGATGTLANNTFLGEVLLPATVASEIEPTTQNVIFPYNAWLLASDRIYCTVSQNMTAGWQVTVVKKAF